MPKSRLPPYCYKGRSAIDYKPYLGKGVKRPTIRLCDIDAPLSEVWAAWERLQEADNHGTLAWLLSEYRESPEFNTRRGKAKARRTITEQERIIDALKEVRGKSGVAFVSLKLREVTPGMIRQLLDKYARDGSPIMGNRVVSVIQVAWAWARERDIVILANPCKGVSRNAEAKGGRYVTDAEYNAVYHMASGVWYLQPAMEIAYMCRLRVSEVLALKWSDLTEDGIRCDRLKGSRTNIVEWSPRLRKAVDVCKARGAAIGDALLFRDTHGVAVKASTFQTAWQRLQVRAEGAGIARFRFHDLKIKGTSDLDGTSAEKQDAGGWREPRMVDRYDRKPRATKPTR